MFSFAIFGPNCYRSGASAKPILVAGGLVIQRATSSLSRASGKHLGCMRICPVGCPNCSQRAEDPCKSRLRQDLTSGHIVHVVATAKHVGTLKLVLGSQKLRSLCFVDVVDSNHEHTLPDRQTRLACKLGCELSCLERKLSRESFCKGLSSSMPPQRARRMPSCF